MLQPIETLKFYQKSPSPQTFKAGEVIFSEGEVGKLMYGVVSGVVEIFVEQILVETVLEGDLFGEGALVHADGLRTSTAIAKTDCVVAFLDKEHFMFAVQQTPMFALEAIKSYSDRFRHLKLLYANLANK